MGKERWDERAVSSSSSACTPAASQMNPLSLLAESLGVQPRAAAVLTSWLTESNKKQNSESKTNRIRCTAPVTTVPRHSVLV